MQLSSSPMFPVHAKNQLPSVVHELMLQTFRPPNKCYTRPTYNASLKPQFINSDLESWNSLKSVIHQNSNTSFRNRIATDNSTISISRSQASYSSYPTLLNHFDNMQFLTQNNQHIELNVIVTRQNSTLRHCTSRGLRFHNNFHSNWWHITSDLRCKCPGPSARNYITIHLSTSFDTSWAKDQGTYVAIHQTNSTRWGYRLPLLKAWISDHGWRFK